MAPIRDPSLESKAPLRLFTRAWDTHPSGEVLVILCRASALVQFSVNKLAISRHFFDSVFPGRVFSIEPKSRFSALFRAWRGTSIYVVFPGAEDQTGSFFHFPKTNPDLERSNCRAKRAEIFSKPLWRLRGGSPPFLSIKTPSAPPNRWQKWAFLHNSSTIKGHF